MIQHGSADRGVVGEFGSAFAQVGSVAADIPQRQQAGGIAVPRFQPGGAALDQYLFERCGSKDRRRRGFPGPRGGGRRTDAGWGMPGAGQGNQAAATAGASSSRLPAEPAPPRPRWFWRAGWGQTTQNTAFYHSIPVSVASSRTCGDPPKTMAGTLPGPTVQTGSAGLRKNPIFGLVSLIAFRYG